MVSSTRPGEKNDLQDSTIILPTKTDGVSDSVSTILPAPGTHLVTSSDYEVSHTVILPKSDTDVEAGAEQHVRPKTNNTGTTSRAVQLTDGTRTFVTVDCHCEGLPARIVLTGLPDDVYDPPGGNIPSATAVRQQFLTELDDFRLALLLEPRGYPGTNLDFLIPSGREDCVCGYIVAEQGKVGEKTACVRLYRGRAGCEAARE